MDFADLDALRDASQDVEKGNFVTLSRTCRGGKIEERLITFSDVYINRYYDASDAKTFREGKEDTFGGYADSSRKSRREAV